MSDLIKIAIGVNETLLNAALDEAMDCPNLQSFYALAGVRSTLIRLGGGNVVMFGAYTDEMDLAEKIESELQLAQDRYVHLNNFLPGRNTYGIQVDLSLQNKPNTRMPTRYSLGAHEDFNFSQVVYLAHNAPGLAMPLITNPPKEGGASC